MTLISNIRQLKWCQKLRQSQDFYESNWDDKKRLSWQLHKFNLQWKEVQKYSPYYLNLSKNHTLPNAFSSWDEVITKLPTSNRQLFQNKENKIAHSLRQPDYYLSTGGTTLTPIRLPAWKSERNALFLNHWIGRSWNDISFNDRLFLLWGHSHLLGKGIFVIPNTFIRNMMDNLLGYQRYSAYDLQERSMELACKKLCKFKPKYVLGYSKALEMMANSSSNFSKKIKDLDLKAVIGTAEGFTSEESMSKVSAAFHAPVAMEYGSAETGVIAHTDKSGNYRTFWQSYFIEANDVSPSGNRIIRVTSLLPRCFPLIRYEIGDELQLCDDSSSGIGITKFKKLIGRSNDYITLKSGDKIHSESFSHCISRSEHVLGFQIVQCENNIKLRLKVSKDFSSRQITEIRSKLNDINQMLANTPIEYVDKLTLTLAGKTKMIINNESN